MKSSGVITIDKSDVHAKGQGQRSKVKVTEIRTNFAPIWAFLVPNSILNSGDGDEVVHKVWSVLEEVLLLFQAICQILRSLTRLKNRRIGGSRLRIFER